MKINSEDDTKFLDKLKHGDEDSYAYLIERYYQKLCVYANSLVNDSLSAEDIVQNVFIRFWKRRQRLRVEHSLESLLYKAVYNEFIDQYRKYQVQLKVEKQYYQHLNAIVNDYDDEKIKKAIKLVYKTVEALPPKCKEVFLLSKKEGLSNVEIANHLNISIKTVEGQISKAFKVIRKDLKAKVMGLLFLLFKTKKVPVSNK